MLMNTASLQPVFAALHILEAVEVTQRLSHESKAAFGGLKLPNILQGGNT